MSSQEFRSSDPIGPTGEPDSPFLKEPTAATEESAAAGTCVFNGQQFSPGSEICQGGFVYRCYSTGNWVATGSQC
jgi:hypothetical protein